jgi:hypothetical protein
MGREKFGIMQKATAGIVNHPDMTETFSLAAVEFQLCGTPVVSRAYGGLLDTVEHKAGGYLARNRSGIFRYLDRLLSDPSLASEMGRKGRDFAVKKFNYKEISSHWTELISDVHDGLPASPLELDDSSRTSLRSIREFLRKLKSRLFVFRMLPPSIYFVHGMESMKLRLERLIA